MACRCRTGLGLLLLLGSVAAIITIAVIQEQWRTCTYEYGIVIDSGSSRSNVYLYEWPSGKENATGIVTEKENCRVEGDGISEMGVDESWNATSWQAFQTCMDKLAEIIPAAKHNDTPLFLGATAGMRLLHQQDEQRANEVLAQLGYYLASLPFNFQNASIISGEEEGLYGWVTVNYLMGNFLQRNRWNRYVRPDGASTVGSMDLGGASTQMAFAVQDESRGADYLQVQLYGYRYNVYSHSFLCYGKNEAEKRVLDQMVQESNGSYLENPCYPEGFNATVKASSIYDTECTENPQNYDPDREIFMLGVPDSNRCGAIVRSIFDFESCSGGANCSFDGVEQPPITGDFMAYAGFYFTAKFLNLDGTSELDDFNTTMNKYCHTHWTELKEKRSWIAERFLKGYCYSAHYVLTLLTDGYKFDRDTWKNIIFQRKVKDTSVGWSLGYMLSESNMIPSEAKEILPLSNPVFAGLIFLFSALTIVTVVFLFVVLVRTCY